MNFFFIEFFLIFCTISFFSLPQSNTKVKIVKGNFLCIKKDTLYMTLVFTFLGILVTMRSSNVGNDTETSMVCRHTDHDGFCYVCDGKYKRSSNVGT